MDTVTDTAADLCMQAIMKEAQMSPPFVKLGVLIAVARECKGWTLRDLERAAGVSNALISQIETGKVKDPGFSTVIRLADALGLSIERVAASVRPPVAAVQR